MSDDARPETEPTGVPPARPAGNAAAAAASRARRIGGRGAVPRPSAPDEGTAPVAAPSLTKPLLPKPPKAEQGSSRTGRPLLAWLPAAVLSAAAIAMVVILLLDRLGGSTGDPSATRDEVLAAAKSCLAATNTYSYKDVDAFEKKGLACGTGDFAVQFAQSVTKVIKKNAPSVKQVQTFQTNYAGIMDVTDRNEWDLLVYGQVNVTNVANTKGRTDPYGALVRMVQHDGTWVISDLNTVCSTTLIQGGNSCK